MRARLLGLLGLTLLFLSAVLIDISHGLFSADDFADRVSASLGDDRVSGFVADRVTDALIEQRPNLTAVRPLLVGATDQLVGSAPFRAVARTAVRSAHQAFFSRTGEEVLLSIPDVGVLVQSVLDGVDPKLAAKLPAKLETVVAHLPQNRLGATVVMVRRGLNRVAWLQRGLFALGICLLIGAIFLHPNRREGLNRAGIGLVVVALLLALLIPAGRLVALLAVDDPGARGALFGVWRAYFLPLLGFVYSYAGTGVILAAAASSLHEKADPFAGLRLAVRVVTNPPATGKLRALWVVCVAATGAVILAWPTSVVTAVAVLGGLVLLYIALRELFRLLLENVPEYSAPAASGGGRRWPLRAAAGVVAAGLLLAAFFAWPRPAAESVRTAAVLSCNGAPELCNRRIDQVSFPATHNSMSSAEIEGWMFPQQSVNFTGQLQNGIRALLIDIHYGFPGGARIKTDLEGEGATREKLVGAVGEEGFEAAQRIRNRLVGVDEGRRGLYFCHGFCELGAYPVAPAFREIRDWLVVHPDEVILLVIEDYVTPQEIAEAFRESGLLDLVYTGPITPFPTLGAMIYANQRVLVFTESGKPGVDWQHPVFDSFQETPYTFHTPAEFSCKPNRGGTTAPLFQVNHWIETTPAPRPTNAEIVNTYDVLLKRARTCERERGMKPTYIAVDFGDIGDIVAVTRTLNGLDTATVGQSGRRAGGQ
ncbi:MAG TPA: hypothetical protein VFV65_08145 [Gemmatimonadales bacterium]|nr:hypothetical protein [Gemmatimonadales bacterium]